MPKYRLKPGVGVHHEGDKSFSAGEVVKSPHPLDEMYPEKFERVTKQVVYDDGDDDDEPAAPKVEGPEAAGFTNVTAKFPEAKGTDFEVWKKGTKYCVIDVNAPSRPLHDEPLNRPGVVEFLEEYTSNH